MTEARAAWLLERQTYIGASEMAEAVGLSPWGDPISLWEKKTGQAPERDESFRMRLGALVEPVIGTLASEALGAKLHRVTGPVRLRDHPYIASNPDFRIVGARGLVQAKFRLNGEEFGEDDGSGDGLSIPLHYRVQGWGELLTTGLDFVYFGVLDPYKGVSLHLLDRRSGENEAAIADLRADLVEYWQQYVVPGVMPPPSAGSAEALARRFPTRVGKVGKVASAEQSQKLQELCDARAAMAAVEERVELLTNEVKKMIGDAAWIEGNGTRFSWGETHKKPTVAWQAVAADYRKIIEGAIAMLDPEAPGLPTKAGVRGPGYVVVDREKLDTIEGLYTTPGKSYRGPFTVAKL